MRRLIRAIDRVLRRRLAIFELDDDPRCLFRVRLVRTRRELELPDGTVPAGSPAIEIHLWNEHLPPLPEGGPDLAWARLGQRLLTASCRTLAARLASDARFAEARVLGGELARFGGGAAQDAMVERLGFFPVPFREGDERPGGFWQDLHTRVMIWTFNRRTLERRPPGALRRTEYWVSREAFLARYETAGDAGR